MYLLRVILRCQCVVLLTLLLLDVRGALKAVATDTAFVHTARYARASRAIALEIDGPTASGRGGRVRVCVVRVACALCRGGYVPYYVPSL